MTSTDSTFKSALRAICELQPMYSASNTPEMQKRGELIRKILKHEIEALEPILVQALGEFGADFIVEASDGIGNKTELPWVRFSSSQMSPKPTEGFYCVLHFSTDGSAVNVVVGCGSSRFHNGSSIPLSDSFLDEQTKWARQVVQETIGEDTIFTDPPNFGATRPLPKSFERASALSKRIAYDDIYTTNIEEVLELAAARLKLVYSAQITGRDVSPADQEQVAVDNEIRGRRGGQTRQGYGLPAAAKKAVELQAMRLASDWLSAHAYTVKDCSSSKPYDFEAKKDNQTIKVEVKGTTSDFADAILMTRNEVNLHRKEVGKTGLIIVSKIRLSKCGEDYVAEGGETEALIGWDINGWEVEPTAFRLSRNG